MSTLLELIEFVYLRPNCNLWPWCHLEVTVKIPEQNFKLCCVMGRSKTLVGI